MTKLFKLSGALLFIGTICSMAMALNFYGVQSLNGLHTTSIFTAPASGIYFINGQLTLPSGSTTGNTGTSAVVAVVSKNYVTLLYTGIAGATGFQIPAFALVSNDLITVGLSSSAVASATLDQGINAVTGQVYFGNAF